MAPITTIVLKLVQVSFKFIYLTRLDRLPVRQLLIIFAWLLIIASSRTRLPRYVAEYFSGPDKYSHIILTTIFLINIKCLPFVWHFRVWKAIFKHLLFQKPRVSPVIGPSTLFLPVITQTRSPPNECDFNLHKSNSSYFSDLDVSRTHIICALLEQGIYKTQRNYKNRLVVTADGSAAKGSWSIVLGSSSCSFKKEIGMFEPYELWTRLLCWDNKWLYFVTHFVKAGTAKPSSYILADETWFTQSPHIKKGKGLASYEPSEPVIYASSICKYVVKIGRLTVHPEVLLVAANVLPPKPGGWHSMSGSPQQAPTSQYPEELKNKTHANESEVDTRWEDVEKLNSQGLEYAEKFRALDDLNTNLPNFKGPALGKFCDFLI